MIRHQARFRPAGLCEFRPAPPVGISYSAIDDAREPLRNPSCDPLQSIDSAPVAASWHGGCSLAMYRRMARSIAMHDTLEVRRGSGCRQVAGAVAVLGACGALVVALGAHAAATRLFVAGAPVQESSEVQQAPAQSSPPSQPKSLDEPERSGKPERRRRIRDEGAEDELQARNRPLLALVDRRAGTRA
jgi:hypothetical protein